jgi:SOS response regulatory protein OraA/RecX
MVAITTISVLPDGKFCLASVPDLALSESQLRSELLRQGDDECIVDDVIAWAKRFPWR